MNHFIVDFLKYLAVSGIGTKKLCGLLSTQHVCVIQNQLPLLKVSDLRLLIIPLVYRQTCVINANRNMRYINTK